MKTVTNTSSNFEKTTGCIMLASLKTKKISMKEISAVAQTLGMRASVLARSWVNFVETGGKTVDKRLKTGYGTLHLAPKKVAKYTKKNKMLSANTAGDTILSYMTTKMSSREVANSSKISVGQLYELIDELNVKGSIMGKRVLDPKKYAKVNVLDVIWLYKHPESRRKSVKSLTTLERVAYEHVADVLLNYLPRTKKFEVK